MNHIVFAPEQSTQWAIYQQSVDQVVENLSRAARDELPDLDANRRIVQQLVAAFIKSPMECMMIALRPSHANMNVLDMHPVNVAILVLEIAQGMQSSIDELHELALMCILHNLGLAKTRHLIELPRELSPEEFEEVSRHMDAMHELLMQLDGLSTDLVTAIRQEHERIDGSGYPDQRRGNQLHRYGKLLAIADVVEAMTHDRPHRSARAPYVVIREILSSLAQKFDMEILKMLVFRLGIFPVGSWVELSSREMALVIETRPKTPLRPMVEVLSHRPSSRTAESRILDLSTTPGVTILRWLDEDIVRRRMEQPRS